MKTRAAIALLAASIFGAFGWSSTDAQADVVYAEIFPNTTDFIISHEQTGWQFHRRTSAALGQSPAGHISSEINVPIVMPVNSFPSDPTEVEGYLVLEGTLNPLEEPILAWTSEYTIPTGTGISKVEWHSFSGNDNSIDTTISFAAQIGGNWYVTDQTGVKLEDAPDGGQFNELDLTAATWKTLNFVPDNALALGDAATLPSGDMTAFGLFEDSFERTLRYDNFTISTPSAPVHPGDFDGDGDVNGADFVAWQTHFPTAMDATLADGDADGDGDVDGADFVVWQTNFPFTPGAGVSSVPEPNALILIVWCGAASMLHCFISLRK